MSRLQEFAAAHLVLWPALAVVLILYVIAFWVRFHRRDLHSTALMVLLTVSYGLGLAVILVSLYRDGELPPWFKKGSVLSALGIFSIATSWLMFLVANKWALHVTTEAEKKRKEPEKTK